ncbi:HNH endonuclease [Pseudomonas syringae pv. aptata]|uniref:HNH endonuclease n=1 Tax=Pseudomonas syringae TaxID=317 RepID=UPI0001CC1DBC|nr:HNH endonuclease [Pseudomonas syringae]KEZ72267.1 HNH endonuclease [Pseudomonas syringae pv. syringae FF5]AZG88160.1 HNH endonuclease [Pseudomonas syringae pv. pisi str. PP1]MCK0542773.1 HNH endonuclease [Pseudomonas syringae pv. aptata]QWB06217.1 HNH endonuclease [Pseudomonas syringae]RMM28902.1 HNH endonuclease domain protein [Pseudomonas syringae pv. pisi]
MARLKTLGNRVATQGDRVSTAPPATWRAGKTTANQRGYNYAWQKARLVHLGANPLCVYCDRAGLVVAASVVDHSVPHRGDQDIFWDRSLWVSLCTHCHSSVKQREESSHQFR